MDNMNFISLATIFVFTTCIYAYGQDKSKAKIYYVDGGGRFITEEKVNAQLAEQQKAQADNKMVVLKNIRSKTIQGDSIIYEFSFMIVSKKSAKATAEIIQRRSDMIGEPLPEFSLQDIHDKIRTNEEFKGKPLVINLWFTSCPPCVKEIPTLNEIKAMPEYAHINFVAITFEKKEKVESFLMKKPFDFTHIVNAKKYCDYFAADGYPVNLFIDKNGILTAIANGIPTIRNPDNTTTMHVEYFLKDLNRIK